LYTGINKSNSCLWRCNRLSN